VIRPDRSAVWLNEEHADFLVRDRLGGPPGGAWRRCSRASAAGSDRSSERYDTSSGRATMMPLCVRTLATYVARSSSRITALRVVDACSSLGTPASSR
jgi:hypothetical protein